MPWHSRSARAEEKKKESEERQNLTSSFESTITELRGIQGAQNAIRSSIDAAVIELRANKNTQATVEHNKVIREWLTIIGLFATAAIAFCSAVKQHDDTLQALQKADTANKLASDTAKKQLQAYTGPGPLSLTCPDCSKVISDPPRQLRNLITFDVKNFGQTPAYNVRVCTFIDQAEFNTAEFSAAQRLQGRECQDPVIFMATMWPQQVQAHQRQLAESEVGLIRSVREHTNDMFVVGYITYDDIFDQHHKAYLCSQFATIEGIDIYIGCGGGVPKDE